MPPGRLGYRPVLDGTEAVTATGGEAVRRLGRQPRLNGLRGVAVAMVLAVHATRGRSLEGGFLGVDMFFVLSGFFITALLIEEFASVGRISVARFYARRALRILPALALFLAACLVIYARVQGDLHVLMTRFILATTCYCANAFEAYGHHLYWAHTWSLSAEEQYYLLWPPLVVLLLWSRIGRGKIVALTAACFIASSLPRALVWRYGSHHGDAGFAFYNPLTHADGLLLGCLLGELYTWNLLPNGRLGRRLLRLGSILALVLGGIAWFTISLGSPFLYSGGYTLVFLGCGLVILGCLDPDPPRALRALTWRPLLYTGRISYGLYLWNPLFLFNYPGSGLNPLLATVLTFAFAAASFRWLETPALRYKRRFAPAPQQSNVVVEPTTPG